MKASTIIFVAMLGAAPTLRAQLVKDGATNTLSNVTNTITGDLTVGTNGSFTLLVLSDNALVTNSVNGVIGLNATAKSNEVRLVSPSARWLMGANLIIGSNGSFNRLVVSNGATARDNLGVLGFNLISSNNLAMVTGSGAVWSNASELYVGFQGAGNQLVVSNGGTVRNTSGYLGPNAGGSNTAVVTGSGSLWSNANDLFVGVFGAGDRLVVSNGATVRNNYGFVGLNTSSSNNAALVTGFGSVWTNAQDLYIGDFSLGNQLVVSNGGTVFTAGKGFIGFNSGASSNSVTATDPGTRWMGGLQSDFYVGSNSPFNRLVVSNGALVADNDGFFGHEDLSSSNLALVTGAGSMWSNRNILEMGQRGSGNRLIVSNGGFLYVSSFSRVGRISGTNNEVVVTGPGSLWTVPFGSIRIGEGGSGNRLQISNGGSVFSEFAELGADVGSNNEAVVTGPGSIWTNSSFTLGRFGNRNRLVVSNAATVYTGARMTLGEQSIGTNNRVIVDGGTLLVTNETATGVLEVRRGTNVFNAGLIEVDQLLLTNALSRFEFNGGTLITRGAFITNGLGFTVGISGVTPAVWDVRAGVSNHVITSDLEIGNNSSLNQLLVTNGGVMRNTYGVIGNNPTSSNNVALLAGSGSVWSNANDLYVGRFGPGNQLVVSNGAAVRNDNGYLGVNTGSSSNLAVVTGVGSVWTSATSLFLGDGDQGNRLLVSNGGVVQSSFGFIGLSFASSNNLAIVTGAGSLWTNSQAMNVGFSGSRNQIIVSNNATLSVGGAGVLGNNIGGNSNSATVIGPGTRWLLGSDLYVGSNGTFNLLLVSEGGQVVDNNGVVGFGASSSNNRALVTGSGSLWSNRTELHIGDSGSANQLFVSNRGTLFTTAESIIGNHSGATSNNVIVTDSGSAWFGASGLYVGNNGSFNRLVISNGGLVAVSGEFTLIGSSSTANGNQATVTGLGSAWSNQFDLLVGDFGSANLLVVSNGGLVISSNGVLGSSVSSSNNVAVVIGLGSVWSNTGDLSVGSSGASNKLLISSGATVKATAGSIGINTNGNGNSVSLTDPGSTWLLASNLLIGSNGAFSSLIISNSALMINSNSFLGFGVSSSSNTVIVSGAGSGWSNRAGLTVGFSGRGNRMTVSDGARVDSNAGQLGSFVSSSNNEVLVSGPNSFWNMEQNLTLGGFGSGNRLVITNGGRVRSGNGGAIGSSLSLNNEVVVTGAGSSWTNGTTLVVGGGGSASRLVISNEAVVHLQGFGLLVGSASSSSNNRVVVDSGVLRVVNDALDIRRGTNVLNSGLIDVQSLLLTNAAGFFEFNGGTLRTAGTTVSNGRVFTVGNGTSPATLQLQGGTHTFSNGLVLANNATLAGNGTIIGNVTVQPGGVLAPGASIGKLILSNSPVLQGKIVMEIGRNGSVVSNDQVQVAGPLTLGGSLVVTNIGPDALTVGSRFPLFTANNYAGSFSSITLPPLPPGFIWTNKLAVDGSLEVTLPQTSLTIQRSNNVLTVSWPTNASSYCLETAYDLTPPVFWQPVANGIVTNASSFFFSLTNQPGIPKQFFRLAFPCSTVPAPVSLAIQISNNLVTVSWPSNAFRLETTFNLAPPVTWQTINSGITNSGALSTFTFTNNSTITNQFFRLIFP